MNESAARTIQPCINGKKNGWFYHSNHFCKITAVKSLLYHQIAFFLLDATLSFISTTCTTSSASIIAQSLIPANTENIQTIDT
jgi:hypothetical protein